MKARARVNWGRWLADCPEPFCNSAETLTPGQTLFHCSLCMVVADVDWPADPSGIWGALAERPREATRNWYPPGHGEAVRLGLPNGQTVDDLRQETRDHETEG